MDLPDKTIRLPFSNRRVSLKYALIHGAYWLLITGFFIYEKKYLIQKANLPYFILCVAGRIGLLIVIAYLNLQYFLPRYLVKKRYLAYFSLVLFSVLGYLAAQSLFDYTLYGFVVGPLRDSRLLGTLSYNFFSTLWYLGLMLALKLSLDWYEQQLLLQKITVEKLHAELDFLRAQINPHFLFNILNNLYALTLKKSDLAPEVVLRLSDMMEYMLYNSSDEKVLLEKEVTCLQNYIELERLRLSGESAIDFQVKAAFQGQEIAPLLLLPLVENASKHGLGTRKEKSWLTVDIGLHQSTLTVVVENAKAPSLVRKSKGGIGLGNLRKRLQLLYPSRHRLQLEDKPDSFLARLEIEL
ncbi:MAG: sensor histidine kinase [Adhaeribacter sp.]